MFHASKVFLVALSALVFTSAGAAPQQREMSPEEKVLSSLNWIKAPAKHTVGPMATFAIPNGVAALNQSDSTKFLVDVTKNLSDGNKFVIAGDTWFGTFHYKATGHIVDDEKIDADKTLASIKEGQRLANEQLKAKGFPTLQVMGWMYPPFYDPATRRLDWAIDAVSEDGSRVVNYNTRILSREGVTSAVLVVDPDGLAAALPEFKRAVAGYQFVAGQNYSEFKQGDKMAEYGLAALIAGGAAAVATKKGLWAVIGGFVAAFWKLLAGAAVAALVGLGSMFKRKAS